MPVSWWTVRATLDGTLILDDEIKVPSVILSEGVMDEAVLMAYGMAQCMLAPAGAHLDIIIQQIQTPWWWD
jgi:hypothetical protein